MIQSYEVYNSPPHGAIRVARAHLHVYKKGWHKRAWWCDSEQKKARPNYTQDLFGHLFYLSLKLGVALHCVGYAPLQPCPPSPHLLVSPLTRWGDSPHHSTPNHAESVKGYLLASVLTGLLFQLSMFLGCYIFSGLWI